MGGNKQNVKPNKRAEKESLRLQQEQMRQEALLAKKKRMNIIRYCAAAAVFIVAVVLCILMLKHDFNSDRTPLLGTYVAEDRYVFTTESGSDISDVKETFAITFYEDGRMMFKRKSGFGIHYFEFENTPTDSYDGTIIRYTNGTLNDRIGVVYGENGDMLLYCGDEGSVNFTIPELVSCFGKERTLSMMAGLYDEDIRALLIEGDYDSITDEQLKTIGTEREKLPEIAFSIKDIPMIFTLRKVADIPLTREDALAIWFGDDAFSDSDDSTLSDDEIDSDDESDA